MKKFLILGGFLIVITCQAQIKNFSIQAGSNYPLIKDVERDHEITNLLILPSTGFNSTVITAGVKESFSSKLGFQLGGQFDYDVSRKFFLTSGVSVSYVRFQRTIMVTGSNNGGVEVRIPNLTTIAGQPFGVIYAGDFQRDPNGNVIVRPPDPVIPSKSENLGNTTSLSVQLPVLMGTDFLQKKLQVRGGAVLSYLLHATEVKDKYEWHTYIPEYKDSSKEGFNDFQAGAMIQTSYRIGQKIGVDFTGQKFFTSIYTSSNQPAGKARYNVLSLGLSYHL